MRPDFSSSVHPPETPVECCGLPTGEMGHGEDCPCRACQLEPGPPPRPDVFMPVSLGTAFRHSGWQAERQRIANAIRDVSGITHRLDRFARCGESPVVLRSIEAPHRYRVVSETCKDRWCLPCSRARSHRIAETVLQAVADRRCRFVTLTIRSQNLPLDVMLDRLYKSFRRLRHVQYIAERLTGGCAFLEVTWNGETRRWHPHLHLVAEGKFIEQRLLSDAWVKATGDSPVVDIRAIRDHRKIAQYITKYVSKGIDTNTIRDSDALCEAIRALHGRRLVLAFGTWARMKFVRTEALAEWERVIDLDTLLSQLRSDPHAQPDVLTRLDPEFVRYLYQWIEEHPPPASSEPHDDAESTTNERQLAFGWEALSFRGCFD